MATPDDTLADLPDDELAARCAARPVDEPAWREFWRRFYPSMYRKVARLLNPIGRGLPPADLDDVVQWVLLKVFQSLPAFDPQKSPLRAYLSVIATTSVVDHLRRSGSRPTVELTGLEFIAEDLASGSLEAEDLWRRVVGILAEMEPRNAELLQEFIEGESPQALAVRHGVPTSHVHAVVYRFRRRLKRDLKNQVRGRSESRPPLRNRKQEE